MRGLGYQKDVIDLNGSSLSKTDFLIYVGVKSSTDLQRSEVRWAIYEVFQRISGAVLQMGVR